MGMHTKTTNDPSASGNECADLVGVTSVRLGVEITS